MNKNGGKRGKLTIMILFFETLAISFVGKRDEKGGKGGKSGKNR